MHKGPPISKSKHSHFHILGRDVWLIKLRKWAHLKCNNFLLNKKFGKHCKFVQLRLLSTVERNLKRDKQKGNPWFMGWSTYFGKCQSAHSGAITTKISIDIIEKLASLLSNPYELAR